MATLHALKSWYIELPRETKLLAYGIGTVVAFGALILRKHNRNKASKDEDESITDETAPNRVNILDNLNNNARVNNNTNKIIIPLSTHRSFWGSYLLSACTIALTFSSRFNSFCTKYIPRIMSHKFTKTFEESLPPIPKTLSDSFKLGQLQKELTHLESLNTNQTTAINEILSQASKILNLKSIISSKNLNGILNRIISIENHKTIMQRISGVFKFVNIMWTLSILGISVTVIPVIYLVGKPIWDEIYNFLKKFLTKVAEILHKLLFNETAYTIYEMIGYFISWYFMYLGLESNGNSTIGFFTSLTGLGLWAAVYIASGARARIRISNDIWVPMSALFVSLLTTPLAYKFNSSKLGMTACSGLYIYLTSVVYGMAKDIIDDLFDGDLSGIGVTVSLIFNTGLVLLKLKNINIEAIEMFIKPTCVIGCVGIYSALFAYSYEHGLFWYHRRSKSIDYWQRQYTMIVSLIAGVGIGTVIGLPAMSSTAYWYTGLYVLQKMIESHILWDGNNIIFTIFGSSIVTWRLALYLHKNPQLFTNMVKFE
eukprot:279359_1